MNTTSLTKYYFDNKEADRAVAFIETMLRHSKGDKAGELLLLEEWQKERIVKPIFGWKNKKTHLRKYRTIYVEIARKNGKSTLGASLALYALFCDKEYGAEIFSVAGDRAQASIIFNLAKSMIEQSPELFQRSKLFRNSIIFPAKGNTYKVLSSDSKLQHGHNCHVCVFDEVHTQPTDELWNVMSTSTASRSQPIMIAMTTAGSSKTDNNICWQLHDYATKVRDGIIKDDSFLPVIFSADEDDDITCEKTWMKANPNYGVSVKKEYLKKESQKAIDLPSYENSFRRLHLSQWVTNETKWLSDKQWMECYEPIDIESLKGLSCYGGLDLASVRDLSSLVLYFPMEDKKDVVLSFFWCPYESIYNRTMKDKLNYNQWSQDGFIHATDGDVQDYSFIIKKINELREIYDIKTIGYDRWNSSSTIVTLVNDGMNMSPFGQGWASMSAPTKELETRVLKKQINHLNNPVMRWMISNVQIKMDEAENIKIDKKKSTEKVDGIVSLVMSIGELLTDEAPGQSVYSDRGLIII